MKIRFKTKEESNKEQLDSFLKLSKMERFYSFLRLSETVTKRFPAKETMDKNKDNFIITIKVKK